MPRKTVRYYCDKCGAGFSSYREAESCELEHIVKDVTDGFKDYLAAIAALNEGNQS